MARDPFVVIGHPVQVRVSIGATTTRGDEPAETILARADAALYAATAHGRDRVESA